MQFLIVLIIVIELCFVLDVNASYILFGVVLLFGIGSVAFALGFLYCGICLLFAKREKAKFVRMDSAGNGKFEVAYYLVDGTEYPCIFPKESILEKKLYRTDMECYVRLNQRAGKVFDRYANTTCILGLVWSIAVSVAIGICLVYFKIL